jgi:O-antigen/teichoic acid export membrane protein
MFACGLAKIIYTFYSDEKHNKLKVFNSNIFTSILLGVLACLMFYPFIDVISNFFANPSLSKYLRIYLFSIPFSIFYLSLDSTLIFFEKIKVSAKILVYSNILKIGLIFFSLQFFNSLTLVFFSLLFIPVFQCFIALINIKPILKISYKFCDFNLIKKQLIFGFPLGVTAIIGVVYKSTDSIMISNLLSVSDYAIYRNGAFEIPFLATLYSSIGAIVLPSISKLFHKKKFHDILVLKRRIISNTFAIIFPMVLFISYFSKDLITTYLSAKYVESAAIFTIFSLLLLVRINDYEDILIVAKKGRFILYIYLVAFFINLLMNYILIMKIGALGAAISTVLTMFFISIFSINISSKIIGYSFKDFFNFSKIFKSAIIFITSFICFLLIDKYLFTDISIIIKFCVYLNLTLFLTIRFRLIEINIIKSVLTSIPFFGIYLLRILYKITK